MTKSSAYHQVADTLRQMCEEQPGPNESLFRIHFTAAQVAERAGVSESTARTHLERLIRCVGYRRVQIGRTYGYRHYKPF